MFARRMSKLLSRKKRQNRVPRKSVLRRSGFESLEDRSMMANVSVGALFLAGILPGVLMGLSLMGMVYFLAVTGRVHCPVEPRASLTELRASFFAGLPAFFAPVMLVGGRWKK